MMDFYRLLEVEPSASEEELRTAIRKARRLWNGRTANPNADIRAEAEQNVRAIAQAERILLDPAEREAYDRSLLHRQEPVQQEPRPSQVDDSWTQEADRLSRQQDWQGLLYLGQRVVSAQPDNALAWCAVGNAQYRMDNLSEAESSIRRSISLYPHDIAYETLGFICLDTDRAQEALRCFQEAARLDPKAVGYRVEQAEALRVLGRYDEAVRMAEEAYQADKSREWSRSIYFSCLNDRALNYTSYNRSSGRHLILNANQLAAVKRELPRLATLASGPKEQRAVEELRQMLAQAEQKRYDDHYGSAIWWVIGFVIALLIPGVRILLAVVVAVLFYATHFKSGLTWNYLNASEAVRRTGLQ